MVSTSFPSVLVVGTLLSTSLQLDGCFADEPSPKPALSVQDGGMWLPGQLSHEAHQRKLRTLGFELPASAYTDLRGYPMGAIAKVGGCSASVVSPLGLIVTNHHCVQGLLPGLSQDGEDLLKSGFIAHRQDQERAAPGFSGSITLNSTDVTRQLLADLDPALDEAQRRALLQSRQDRLVANCQEEHRGLNCSITSFFDANHYELQISEPLNDLRLVYVPAEGIGWFGGDEDNWRWPRHTPDFAFLRAYGADGKPLMRDRYLRIASERLAPSDPVMIAGYPGRTYRYQTGARVQFAQNHGYPYLIDRLSGQVKVAQDLMAQAPELEAMLRPRLFGLTNSLINAQATLEGLARSQFADERLVRDQMLDQWIKASPERMRRFGTVVQESAALSTQEVPNFRIDQDIKVLEYNTVVLSRGLDIVRQAKIRANGGSTSAEQVEQFVAQFNQNASPSTNPPGLEQLEMQVLLERMTQDSPEGASRVRSLLDLSLDAALTPDDIRTAIAKLYQSTGLLTLDTARELFEGATLASLEQSSDGFIKAALALNAIQDRIDAAKPSDINQTRRLRRLYTQARVQHAEDQSLLLAPDANRSLRISYGKVQGYSPLDQDFIYPPFTTGAQLLAKHQGEYPFALPEAVVDALKQRDYGHYFDPQIGDIPVNFLSTTDATGGNSGSATLNGKGEIVGLLFDGNYEGVMSDWYLDPEITRSIHVDLRFVLWMLDTVIPAHRLLLEMGIAPRQQSVASKHYRFSYAKTKATH